MYCFVLTDPDWTVACTVNITNPGVSGTDDLTGPVKIRIMTETAAGGLVAVSATPDGAGCSASGDLVGGAEALTCEGVEYVLQPADIAAKSVSLKVVAEAVNGPTGYRGASEPILFKLGALTAAAPTTSIDTAVTVGQKVPISVVLTNDGPSPVTDAAISLNGAAAVPCSHTIPAHNGTVAGNAACSVNYTVVAADVTTALTATPKNITVGVTSAFNNLTIAQQIIPVNVITPLKTSFTAQDCTIVAPTTGKDPYLGRVCC
jgi:hypothetical protein